MLTGDKSTEDRVKALRSLSENEKTSLIFTQQRKIGEYQDRVKAFECAHTTGQCPTCRDKDLTISHLQQQIEALRSKLFGRSSERHKKIKKDKGTPGKPPQPSNRTRLPSEQFPDARLVECTVEDAEIPHCLDCKNKMTDSGMRETAERIDCQPAELIITRTNRVRYHCKCCQSAPKTAALPARLAPGTSMGDSFIIQACISKFYDLIPTTRFAKILTRSSAKISHNLLLKAQSIMASIYAELYLAIKLEILNSLVVFADETVHRQLEDNKGKWRWFLWAFCTKTSIYFEIHDTRAGDVSIEFLVESTTALYSVSDAYSGYSRTIREVNRIRQDKKVPLLKSCLCNDHGRRYFFYAQSDPQALRALDLYDKIYEIEREVQKLLLEPIHPEPKNSDQALILRQTADPLFNQIYDISCAILLESPEKSPEAVAAKYFLNNLTGLTAYLQHIELPISNAPAERGIRSPVVLRKMSLGNHSQSGAAEAAIHLSVMGSCKMNDLNPTEYYEFNRDRYLEKQPLLTPYQFKLHKDSLKTGKPPHPL